MKESTGEPKPKAPRKSRYLPMEFVHVYQPDPDACLRALLILYRSKHRRTIGATGPEVAQ